MANIRGWILDRERNPISGVTITATGPRKYSIQSKENGYFEFEKIETGPYIISAKHTDYVRGRIGYIHVGDVDIAGPTVLEILLNKKRPKPSPASPPTPTPAVPPTPGGSSIIRKIRKYTIGTQLKDYITRGLLVLAIGAAGFFGSQYYKPASLEEHDTPSHVVEQAEPRKPYLTLTEQYWDKMIADANSNLKRWDGEINATLNDTKERLGITDLDITDKPDDYLLGKYRIQNLGQPIDPSSRCGEAEEITQTKVGGGLYIWQLVHNDFGNTNLLLKVDDTANPTDLEIPASITELGTAASVLGDAYCTLTDLNGKMENTYKKIGSKMEFYEMPPHDVEEGESLLGELQSKMENIEDIMKNIEIYKEFLERAKESPRITDS